MILISYKFTFSILRTYLIIDLQKSGISLEDRKMKSEIKNDLSNTLVICVERGNEITLEYSKKTIIDKINSYFGYKLINTIRLETINIKNNKFKNKKKVDKLSKNFEEKINRIKNIEIKKSLNKLLHAMKND